MPTAPSDILALLACPESRRPLRRDGAELVEDGPSERRYPVEAGFPILLPRSVGPVATAVGEAFRSRSATYFPDNYSPGRNPERAARQHRVTELLEQLVRPDSLVLEAGAGPAVLGEALRARAATYVALDLSLHNLLAARERIGEFHGVVGDLTALPVADHAFDGTVAIGCLEYVPDLEAAVGELCRATAPEGFILATFANANSPRRWWDEAVIHRLSRWRRRRRGEESSIYGRRLTSPVEATEMFERAGARVDRIERLNPGLIGYPLSASGHVRRAEEGLARRFGPARARASELIVLARKPKG
jgi:SAM-dependent methyltransferase/uncharacterized protein YbaR (Trm112 family)